MKLRALLLPILLALPIGSALAQSAPRQSEIVSEISSPVFYRPQPFDVLGYDATLDLRSAPAKDMSGVCTITLVWTDEPTEGPFRFHLRSLIVDSVRFDGAPVTAEPFETPPSATFHYMVSAPPGVRKGDTSKVRVWYHGVMTGEVWGGVQSSGGTLYAMGVGFSNNYVSATEHWLPCYDHPSDKATFTGRFIVDGASTVASNGVLTTVPINDSTRMYEWRHDIPCATYLYTFAVDQYLPVHFGDGTPEMVVYGRVRDTTAIRRSFKLLPRMVDLFERRFIPYPFEKVGYVTTPTGAMEHETMISFNTPLAISGDTVNSVAAHELAHQWFGDLVTPLDYRHTWLTESFATFSESLWAEELGGQAGYLKELQQNLLSYVNTVARGEGTFPLYDYPRTNPSSNYPQTIYVKGAVVVGMLRYELGDSLFFAGLQEYLRRFAYGTATTDSLRTVLEQTAGRSLGWFFDQWVYGKGWPQLSITTKLNDASEAEIHIVQTQPAEHGLYTGLPVEIGFVPPSGPTVYHIIRLDSRDTTVKIRPVGEFRALTVNQGPTLRALLRATISPLSGVPEEIAASDSGAIRFVVRPNPARSNGSLTVELRGTGDCAGIEYQMFETTGRRILLGYNDSCEFPIPTQGFASGAYVLRFKYKGTYYDVPVAIAR